MLVDGWSNHFRSFIYQAQALVCYLMGGRVRLGNLHVRRRPSYASRWVVESFQVIYMLGAGHCMLVDRWSSHYGSFTC